MELLIAPDTCNQCRESCSDPCVSIVVPVYNETELIARNIGLLTEAMGRLACTAELILVNDGSTDDTLEKAMLAACQHSHVRILSYRENRGRGFAIRHGIEHARGGLIVVTEADLSYGEEIVSRLVQHLEGGEYDCVVASPHVIGGGMQGVPWNRALVSRLGNRLLSCLMPVALSTYTGMTRAYRREAVRYVDLESDGKEIHLEIIVKLSSLGYSIGELPAQLIWPEQRRSRRNQFVPWRSALSHLCIGMGEAPFLLLGSVGLATVSLVALLATYSHYFSAADVSGSDGPLLILLAVCVLTGFLIIAFGYHSHHLRRVERRVYRAQRNLVKLQADCRELSKTSGDEQKNSLLDNRVVGREHISALRRGST